MKFSILFIALFSLLVGCASDPTRNDSEKDTPSSWNGSPSQTPTNLSGYQNYGAPPDAGMALVEGIVDAGVALASDRGYYKHSAVTGRVVCRGQGNNDMEIPCGRVTVVIADEKGKELARTDTEGSNFAFRVKNDATYRLRIDSKKYVMTPSESPDVRLGDDVILRLSLR